MLTAKKVYRGTRNIPVTPGKNYDEFVARNRSG